VCFAGASLLSHLPADGEPAVNRLCWKEEPKEVTHTGPVDANPLRLLELNTKLAAELNEACSFIRSSYHSFRNPQNVEEANQSLLELDLYYDYRSLFSGFVHVGSVL